MVNSQEGHNDEGSYRTFINSTLITPSNKIITMQLARGSTGKPQALRANSGHTYGGQHR